MLVNEVLKNIELLKQQLEKVSLSVEKEIVSVIIDGSVIRGDFIEDSSDIDLTITTSSEKINVDLKSHIEELVKKTQSKLPKREYPRKPLLYDIQWQDINLVRECGERELRDWNVNNIPSGYPKLWLYAFDSIKHHEVIYGQDITQYYTKIKPQYFVPIRMKRIQKSVIDLGDKISDYEMNNGAITQIKNAWETIRCICVSKGLLSIKKDDIYLFSKTLFSERADLKIIEDLYCFYLSKENNKLLEGEFRKKLHDFTLDTIQQYYWENRQAY